MAAHAKLSPSGAKGWMKCPGKIAVESAYPQTKSTASDNGTACHTVGAECLLNPGLQPSDWAGDFVIVSEPLQPKRKVFFDDTLVDITTQYVDTIRALTRGLEINVETKTDFSSWVDVADSFGTVDVDWVVFLPETRSYRLVICDLKTGYKFVPIDTPQLRFYALGRLTEMSLSHNITEVCVMIFQPQHGGMREKVYTVAELEEFAVEARQAAQKVEVACVQFEKIFTREMTQAEWEAEFLNPAPNEDDCAFCKHMPNCSSFSRSVEEIIGARFEAIVEDGAHPVLPDDNERLSKAMRATDMVEDWVKSVRAEVERRLLVGIEVPAYGLELGRQGPRKWKDPEKVAGILRDTYRFTLEDVFDMDLKSPTSIEKMTKGIKLPSGAVITPKLGAKRWKDLQKLVVRADPKPSVKPLAQIKVPYKVPAPTDDAFDKVEEELW